MLVIVATVVGVLLLGGGRLGGAPSPPAAAIDSTPTIAPVLPSPTTVTPAAPAKAAGLGSISGQLSYPSEYLPPMDVALIRVDDGGWLCERTDGSGDSYRIANVPPGRYHVIAYEVESGLAGAYSEFVRCGLSASCTDHSLVEVEVLPGRESSGIDPSDWYAPEDAFPPNPCGAR